MIHPPVHDETLLPGCPPWPQRKRSLAREFASLLNTIVISVTVFFRDPEAWELVSAEVIPRMLAERSCFRAVL